MMVFKKLEKKIDEELRDSETYIRCALEYKETDRDVADVFYLLSQEEMAHADRLHKLVTDKIERYRREEGEVPQDMMALHTYLHDEQIEKGKEIRIMWSLYK